jgi:hypothetical protein
MSKRVRFLEWSLLLLLSAFLCFSVYNAVKEKNNRASWLQVAIEALALPVVLYELNRIRTSLEEKPELTLGVASVKELPLSNIGRTNDVPKSISISRGYPFFMLIIQNKGPAMARAVKIHFEYLPPPDRHLLTPVIKTYEWKEDKRYAFSQENNVDFVFIGGSDWYIHPGDFEAFSFFMTTVVVLQKEPHEIRERPEPGRYEFTCSVRAEGLTKPVSEHLHVEVIE